jgi:hypothetical protein
MRSQSKQVTPKQIFSNQISMKLEGCIMNSTNDKKGFLPSLFLYLCKYYMVKIALLYYYLLGWTRSLPKLSSWFDRAITESQLHCGGLEHGLRTPSEEIAVTARPKIKSQPQILRKGQSIFCLPHWPKISDFFWFMPSLGVRSPCIGQWDLLRNLVKFQSPC